MRVTYTKNQKTIKKNCYQINLTYTHGDADSYTYDVVELTDVDEKTFLDYMSKLYLVIKMIDDNTSHGVELPEDFSESTYTNFGNYSIPIEEDNYAKLEISNYYANIAISELFYTDEHGELFTLTIE